MLSVICPIYNEEKYIVKLMDFFLSTKPEDKELILIDGGSRDKTLPLVESYQKDHPEIRLFHNPRKYVPYALNIAIREARGEMIVRLDAHTAYAEDYFEQILAVFEKTGADIVGGPTRTACAEPFQCAVGYAISTKMGVGDSKVHDDKHEGYVDSVTFGSWRKSMFAKTGYFDEQLMRNQDDEFHYRAKSLGMKLYLSPAIKLYYYPRSTAKGLFKQYFQYGLYKPLVLKKVGSETKLRHLIPSGFVLYLLSLPLAFCWPIWLAPLGLYALLALIFSLRCPHSLKAKLSCLAVYPILHTAYGSGFLLGLNKKPIPRNDMALPLPEA